MYHHTPEPKGETSEVRVALEDVPGVTEGKSIVWAHGNQPSTISEREKTLIKKACGLKTVNVSRCLHIKTLLLSRSPAEIIRLNKGRRGYGERMVYGIHAALSKAKGEGF